MGLTMHGWVKNMSNYTDTMKKVVTRLTCAPHHTPFRVYAELIFPVDTELPHLTLFSKKDFITENCGIDVFRYYWKQTSPHKP